MKTRYRIFTMLCVLFLSVSVLTACYAKDPATQLLPKDLVWAVGAPLPLAEDFFDALPEGVTVKYDKAYEFTSLGTYTVTLIYTDAKGRDTELTAKLTLALDEEPPVIEGAKDISIYVGDGISYRNGVTVTDNFAGKTSLEIDSSAVDASQEGFYPVLYTARDAAGNVTTVQIMVWVWREAITEDMLWGEIDSLISRLSLQNRGKEQQARAIYNYVHESIVYTAYSDKNNWVRAAYEGLRTGQGDCFTYFAISKAFFQRLGIENMDIQRTQGIVTERHYWNYVNIGTSESPLWYHFDACRLSGVKHSGCLLTNAQVNAYTKQRVDENGVGNYFYAYDVAAYPDGATEIITPTPTLEPYD